MTSWWDKNIVSCEDAISVLREARKFLRDDISYLARAMGVHRDTIRSWEMGKHKPRLDAFQREFIKSYVIRAQESRKRLAGYLSDCTSLYLPSAS